MEKILVTGTDGFIGSNLVKELELYDKFQIYKINEDIFSKDSWTHDLLNLLLEIKPTVIFHVGACSDTLEQNVNYMMTRNFESTKILVDYSFEHQVPIIYSSSAANYGVNNMYPSNLYGWSKYVAEQYVISKGGIGLRYFNVYGPGEENKGKMASVAYQMHLKKMKGEKVYLFPKKPRRDFVYVKDVVNANIFAWENYQNSYGKYYEVGSGVAMGFEDVLDHMEIVYEYTDEKNIPVGYQFYTCSDKNKWLKDWTPKWSLKDGINDYKNFLLK